VKRVLKFDESVEYQAEYLGFKDTSQQAAIVDGVLVENGLLRQDPLSGKWNLATVDKNTPLESLRTVLTHFQTAGDRPFSKLFAKLVEPPFGIPNGIIPLLCALVFRSEGPRIVIYSGASGQRVSDARVADALVDMAKHPGKYQTRYTKLAGKQRIVFKAIGPVVGVEFAERLAGGEAFYTYCEQVRSKLKDWVNALPESALKITELTETQRKLLRTLRGPVPPQLPLLADGLVEFAAEDSGTHEELAGTGTAAAFPAIASAWRTLREKIERHVEGVKVPVRTAVRTLVGEPDSEEPVTTSKLAEVIRSVSDVVGGPGSRFQQIADRLDQEDYPDPAVALPAVLSGKPPESLFAPVPSITSVCKMAVLTGTLPDQCGADLLAALSRTYRLNGAEVQLSASWQDAERLRLAPATRLVVYRENRIDEQLHHTGSYRVLVEDSSRVLLRVAQLVARWVTDFRCLHQALPLALLTADHGFTYGPPPGQETQSHRPLNPTHRCVEIEGAPSAGELSDGSLTFLDQERFHLSRSYVAARGRYFGTGTASGWALSHGGLLPEEVIIPVVEWFSGEPSLLWPDVAFPDGGDASHVRQSMILLIGYSTMPLAPAALSWGISARTRDSSRMVFTATQSGSDRAETVGFCRAGSKTRILFRSARGTFIISPTLPSAFRQACSIRAMLSSFCRIHGSPYAF